MQSQQLGAGPSASPPRYMKAGWPWVSDETCASECGSDQNWPLISVVLPTFNHGRYIEASIRSVLLQGYPALELIVIDGGSLDDTIEIIKRYERFLAHWESEPDRGQTHAINKGMSYATGEIRAYLNTDDIYLPGALFEVARYFRRHPEVDLIHGGCLIVDDSGACVGRRIGDIKNVPEMLDLWGVWWRQRNFVQPEVFWTAGVANRVGPFREELHYVMDYDYWLRIALSGGRIGRVERDLAAFRLTPGQKSSNAQAAARELRAVVRPGLWSKDVPLSHLDRLQLQAKWLYDEKFVAYIEDSLRRNDSRWARWTGILLLVLRNPQLFACAAFYSRAYTVARSKFG